MKNKYLWVAVISTTVLILDQITKHLIMMQFRLYETVPVIRGFFNLTYVRNKGAAFGFLAGAHGAWRSAFFVGVSVVALAVIATLVAKSNDRFSIVSFALIGGGAAGNLVDRFRFGEVVDFIEWYYKSYHWPAFNVADSAITVGVTLMAVDLLFRKPDRKPA